MVAYRSKRRTPILVWISGFTEVPCSLLQFAADSGEIPAEFCNDELRTLPQFREACGCPALPPTEAPVAAPTEMPVVAPTDLPVVAPTDMPVLSPTDARITDMPVVTPTNAPVTAMPVASPVTDMPVVAPTNVPVMPAPTPTEAPEGKATVIPTSSSIERCIRRKRA